MAERHRFQQARCRLCGAILRADGTELVLDGIGTSYIIYHWFACAMLIVMHYFAGSWRCLRLGEQAFDSE